MKRVKKIVLCKNNFGGLGAFTATVVKVLDKNITTLVTKNEKLRLITAHNVLKPSEWKLVVVVVVVFVAAVVC